MIRAEKGGWNGEPVEGYVVRTIVGQAPTGEFEMNLVAALSELAQVEHCQYSRVKDEETKQVINQINDLVGLRMAMELSAQERGFWSG